MDHLVDPSQLLAYVDLAARGWGLVCGATKQARKVARHQRRRRHISLSQYGNPAIAERTIGDMARENRSSELQEVA